MLSNLKIEIFANLSFACRFNAILQNKGKRVIIADLDGNYQPQARRKRKMQNAKCKIESINPPFLTFHFALCLSFRLIFD
jgi:hypothetical protein